MSDLITALTQTGLQVKESGGNVGADHVNIHCPFCYEERFHCGIHLQKGFYHCWVCDTKGGWWKLLNKLAETTNPQYLYQVEFDDTTIFTDTEVIKRLPPELKDITRPFDSFIDISDRDARVWNYLIDKRYLPEKVISQIQPGIGIGRIKNYVTFQEKGNLVARNIGNNGPRWWKNVNTPFVWGLYAVREVSPSWVAITEGVFDALAFPYGHAVSFLMSTQSTSTIARLAQTLPDDSTELILVLDNNLKYSSKTISGIRLELNDLGFKVYVWDWTDNIYDELLDEDPKLDIDRVRIEYGYTFIMDRVHRLLEGEVDDNPLF